MVKPRRAAQNEAPKKTDGVIGNLAGMSAAMDAAPEPTPAVDTAPEPTPVVDTAPAPTPVVDTAPAPTPAVDTAPALAPAGEWTELNPREMLTRLQTRHPRSSSTRVLKRTSVSVPLVSVEQFETIDEKLIVSGRDPLIKQQWVDAAIELVLAYPERYADLAESGNTDTVPVPVRMDAEQQRTLRATAGMRKSHGRRANMSELVARAMADIIAAANKGVRVSRDQAAG